MLKKFGRVTDEWIELPSISISLAMGWGGSGKAEASAIKHI